MSDAKSIEVKILDFPKATVTIEADEAQVIVSFHVQPAVLSMQEAAELLLKMNSGPDYFRAFCEPVMAALMAVTGMKIISRQTMPGDPEFEVEK